MSNHTDRAKRVLTVAIIESVRGKAAASGPSIRERVKSCLETALAICKEDAEEMYEQIDKARKQ